MPFSSEDQAFLDGLGISSTRPSVPNPSSSLFDEADNQFLQRLGIVPKPEGNFFQKIGGQFRAGLQQAEEGLVATGLLGGYASPETLGNIIRENNLDRPDTPPELQELYNEIAANEETRQREVEEKGFGATIDFYVDSIIDGLKNPEALLQLSANAGGTSAPALITGGVGAVAGGLVGGPVGASLGFAGGTFIGSFALEYGSKLLDVFQEHGINTADPVELSLALNDPLILNDAKERAALKAGGTATVDALFNAFAGRLATKSVENFVGRVGNVGADVGIQTIGEGASEGFGNYLAEGEVNNQETVLEALGGFGAATVDVGIGAYARTLGKDGNSVGGHNLKQLGGFTLSTETGSNLKDREKVEPSGPYTPIPIDYYDEVKRSQGANTEFLRVAGVPEADVQYITKKGLKGRDPDTSLYSSPDASVINTLPLNLSNTVEGRSTVAELKPGEIGVSYNLNKINARIEQITRELSKLNEVISTLPTLDAINTKRIRAEFEAHLSQLEAQKQLREEVYPSLVSLAAKLAEQFGIKNPLAIVEAADQSEGVRIRSLGAIGVLEGGQSPTIALTINSNKIQKQLGKSGKKHYQDLQAEIISTFYHELGHGFVERALAKAPENVRTAFQKLYQSYVSRNGTASVRDTIHNITTGGRAEDFLNQLVEKYGKAILDKPFSEFIQNEGANSLFQEDIDYFFGISEFVAEQFAKYKTSDKRKASQKITGYHLTNKDFEEFTLDTVGKGQGQTIGGYGVNFSTTKEGAQGYSEFIGDGNIVEATLDVKQDELLDLNKTIKEQSSKVKELLNKINFLDYIEKTYASKYHEGLGSPEAELGLIFEDITDLKDVKAISKILEDAGIKGTKRIGDGDQSTAPQEITVFNPKNIKKGKPAPQNAQVIEDNLDLEIAPFISEVVSTLEESYPGLNNPVRGFEEFINALQVNSKLVALQESLGAELNAETVIKENQGLTESRLINIFRRVKADKAIQDRLVKDTAVYNKFLGSTLTLLQLAKLNKNIPGVQEYRNLVEQWHVFKSEKAANAGETARRWMNQMTGTRGDQFAQFLFELTTESDKQGRRFSEDSELFQKLIRKYNIEARELEIYREIDGDFRNIIDELQRAEEARIREVFKSDAVKQQEELLALGREMDKLRNKNYFPLPRFGEYTLTVRATEDTKVDGDSISSGSAAAFYTFESKRERESFIKNGGLKEFNSGPFSFETSVLTQETYAYLGMPQAIVDRVIAAANLTPEQAKVIQDLSIDMASIRSFKKQFARRKGTKGYSQDALRGYADYMLRASNHIARLKYQGQMDRALKKTADLARQYAEQAGVTIDTTKTIQLHNNLREHMDYLFNPGTEWSSIRALGAHWYLGLSPKSALVNLTQLPLTTYPYLASRFGDAKALSVMTGVVRDFSKTVFKKNGGLNPEEAAVIERGIKEGFIDESLYSELAALQENKNLNRARAFQLKDKLLLEAAHVSMFMFQSVEKLNRRLTTLAAYRLAKQSGMDNEAAFQFAKEAAQTTQFEYARYNRPKLMRGRKGLIFMFQLYMQQILFFLATEGRQPGRLLSGRARYMVMLLAMAGIAGLPGAEDAGDIADDLATKYKELLGYKNPKVDLRADIKEFVESVGVNSDLAMHGLGRYVFGMFDMSSSLSMGKTLPTHVVARGVEFLTGASDTTDPADRFSRDASEFGGAGVAAAVNIYNALHDPSPDGLKRWEKAMPTFMRNIARAYRYGTRGEETRPSGSTLVEFDVTDPIEMAAVIAGTASGFRLSEVAEKQEVDYTVKESANYYISRRKMLLSQFDYALELRDSEARQDVQKAIKTYNQSVPFPIMKITIDDLKASRYNRVRGRGLEEKGIAREKFLRPYYRDIRDRLIHQENN